MYRKAVALGHLADVAPDSGVAHHQRNYVSEAIEVAAVAITISENEGTAKDANCTADLKKLLTRLEARYQKERQSLQGWSKADTDSEDDDDLDVLDIQKDADAREQASESGNEDEVDSEKKEFQRR